jgi:hypothetical protein
VKFEEFRRLCLSFPEAEERETWDVATFRVNGRIFAMGSSEATAVSLKASLDDQAGLLAMDSTTFSPAPYAGRYGWVSVRLARLRPDLAERMVRNAWARTAPKRLVVQATASSAGGQIARRRE